MSEVWTSLKVLDWTTARFDRAGIESPRLEAQILLAHTLACDRIALYTSFEKPLGPTELTAFRDLVRRRLDGECVAYLTGTVEFWSRSFDVDARVLVPRADTETIITVALAAAPSCPAGAVADIGTGSGVIAVTLACELVDRDVIAVDLSKDALAVAARNADRHGVAERVSFRLGDLAEPLAAPVALLVANLPYVASAEIDGLAIEVRKEPRAALDGGADGLDLIRRLIATAAAKLLGGGLLALEHGEEQGQAVRNLLSVDASFEAVETTNDLAGRERVTAARRRTS